MRALPITWQPDRGWSDCSGIDAADLVLYFGTRELLSDGKAIAELAARFAGAHVVGCSTGGQFDAALVADDRICATVFKFDATGIKVACESVEDAGQSRRCGVALGEALLADDLAAVFVLSDGLHVNGSSFVLGMTDVIGRKLPITGGLAGDGAAFEHTLVGCDGPPRERQIAAIGFYGSAIRVGHGSAGGWDVFGPRRKITRSEGNVLYEVDGQPALDLYERYLGEEDSRQLPGSALLFPIKVFPPEAPDHGIVRTVLAVDRDARSMTFAGDVPEGWTAQLMRGHFSRLIDGAADASRQANGAVSGVNGHAGVAIFVSCIGRRLLLGQRVDEEIDAAISELPHGLTVLGFYSYGEVSPHATSGVCEMHNQTMTVTTLTETPG